MSVLRNMSNVQNNKVSLPSISNILRESGPVYQQPYGGSYQRYDVGPPPPLEARFGAYEGARFGPRYEMGARYETLPRYEGSPRYVLCHPDLIFRLDTMLQGFLFHPRIRNFSSLWA